MRRTGRDLLVVVARKNFRDVAERSIKREQGVGPKIGVSGKRLVVTVFANRGPSGKEWPHRTKVVSAAVVDGGAIGNDTHTPIRLVIGIGKLLNGGLRLIFVGDAEPHGNSGQHGEFVHSAVLLIEREGERFLFRRPESLIEGRSLAIESNLQVFTDVILAGQSREIS